jgi:uncharacterized membrane protein
MKTATLVGTLMVLLVGFALAVGPFLSRKGFFFGWTVPPGFVDSAPGRRIRRIYVSAIAAATALSALIMLVEVKMGSAGLILMLVTQALALGWARHRVKAYRVEPELRRSASLLARESRLPGGWLAWLAPLTMPLISMTLAWRNWVTIPDRVPIHWNAAGQADRWVSKTWWGVNATSLIGLSAGLALVMMAWHLAHSRRTSPSGEAAASETSRQYFSMLMLLGILYLLNTLFLVTNLQLLKVVPQFPPLLMLTVLAGTFVVMLGLIWRYAQRRREFEAAGDGTPDDCWHLGLFYANSRDPAVLVEQRVGFGYTLNFGRPMAWVILALAVLPGVAMSFLR